MNSVAVIVAAAAVVVVVVVVGQDPPIDCTWSLEIWLRMLTTTEKQQFRVLLQVPILC